MKIAFRKTLLTAFVFCLVTQSHAALMSGLVAYYPLRNNANDASGKRNNGAVIGYDWKFSHGLYLNTNSPVVSNFDGAYIIVPRSSSLDFNQDFTLSVWTKIPQGLPAYYVHNLIGNGPDDTSANLRIISDVNGSSGPDYVQFLFNHGTGDIHAFVEPLRDKWGQVVVVRSGTDVSLFRNGVLVTNSIVSATVTNLPTIWLGRYSCTCPPTECPSSYPLIGGIGNVRMYNRGLSTVEVLQLYRREKNLLR